MKEVGIVGTHGVVEGSVSVYKRLTDCFSSPISLNSRYKPSFRQYSLAVILVTVTLEAGF